MSNTSTNGERGRGRVLQGTVVNNTETAGRSAKTVVVEVVSRYKDPVYGKYVKRSKKFHAHDEKEQYKTNDIIEIRECRPRSKKKRWETVRLVTRPEVA